MKKCVSSLCILILLFIITACADNDTSNEEEFEKLSIKISQYKSEIEELQNQINNYEVDMKELKETHEVTTKQLTEKIEKLEIFSSKAIEYLKEDEMLALAKNQWHYEITINGEPLPIDGIVDIEKDSFDIAIVERQTGLDILPSEIYNQGALSGKYFEHLTIKEVEPTNISGTDGTTVTSFIYEFENTSPNTTVKIEISNELKDRLELQTNTINVHFKCFFVFASLILCKFPVNGQTCMTF